MRLVATTEMRKRIMPVLCCTALVCIMLIFVGSIPSTVQAQESREAYELLWSYATGGERPNVSASADGSYIAAWTDRESINNMYFLNREGKLLWKYGLGGPGNDVSISEDGSYIAAVGDNNLYFFNQGGKLLWKRKGDNNGFLEVSISSDGSCIVVQSLHWGLHVYNQQGKLLWNSPIGAWQVSMTGDGSYIAVASADKHVYLFNQQGTQLWKYNTGGDVYGGGVYAVSITTDGSYIVATTGDKAFFLNREGNLLWNYETGGTGVSISPDGNHIIISGLDGVSSLNREGKLLWSNKTAKGTIWGISTSPYGFRIEGGGMNRKVYLLNEEGNITKTYSLTEELWLRDLLFTQEGPIMICSSADGNVHLFISTAILENSLSNVRNLVLQDKSKGFNVDKAEGLLSEAEEALNRGIQEDEKQLVTTNVAPIAGNFQHSYFLALEAKELALDIDGDGILNERDFAPTVKNSYIYAGGAVLVLGLIVFSFAARRRYHLNKQAKLVIERQKRELIAVIDKALKET